MSGGEQSPLSLSIQFEAGCFERGDTLMAMHVYEDDRFVGAFTQEELDLWFLFSWDEGKTYVIIPSELEEPAL